MAKERISRKASKEQKLFAELIPTELQKEARDLQEADARSHRGGRERLDRIYQIALRYQHDEGVIEFLEKTGRKSNAGRRASNAFYPFVKWLAPNGRVTEWAQQCWAAAYYRMVPSAAIASPDHGNGNAKHLVDKFKVACGLMQPARKRRINKTSFRLK